MPRCLALILILFTHPLIAVTDPIEVNVKVLALYLSTNAYCVSPIEVFTTAEAGFVDFLGGPTIGQLDNSKYLYDGSYKCAIIKLSETIKFVPLIGSGTCVAGNRFETNICAEGVVTTAVDGTTSTCTSASGDNVYLYLSTASTMSTLSTSSNPFAPPTAALPTNGLTLANAINISGAITLRFIVNTFGKIGVVNGACDVSNPTFDLTL